MPRLFNTLSELEDAASPVIKETTNPILLDPPTLRNNLIDDLLYTALFTTNETLRQTTSDLIEKLTRLAGSYPASIYPLYQAFGQRNVSGFAVPAVNIRTLTYDTARLIFRIMETKRIGTVVFEIARSEIEYTCQRPEEYAVSIFAAAIKEGYRGPIFLQGDHDQFSKKHFDQNQQGEIDRLKALILESLNAKFYNIDIDASTLVDLSKEDLKEQQKDNSEMTALLTGFIREKQPKDITISIGGEIGHIGDRNSTLSDFEAFMSLYQEVIPVEGISKVSVQTGTRHGGTPLPDGTIKEVTVDFSVLKSIGEVAREKYHLAGVVQHGASTLPLSEFDHFVENNAVEVHLATGLQNIVYDNLPGNLRKDIYAWITQNLSDQKTTDQTEEQFIYKNRKKALGPFKRKLWDLTDAEKAPIISALSEHLLPIFEKLKTFETRDTADRYF